jgi:hypothetical protein
MFWNNHTSTASGSVAKYVCCEQCSVEFGYILHRQRTGHAVSLFFLDETGAASRARQRAESGLRRALESGVDPCSCPKCDHLQKNMVREAGRRYLGWMSFGSALVALVLAPAAFLLSLLVMNALSGPEFLIPLPIFYSIWVGIIVAVLLMPFLRLVLAAFYDPGKLTPEQLVRRGIYHGVPLEDWEAVQERTELELRRLGITSFPPRHPRPQPGLGTEGADRRD